MPLTHKEITALAPSTKSYRKPDIPGLALLVNPNGSKYWIASVVIHGKRTTKSLGSWPTLSTQEAREAFRILTSEKSRAASGQTFRQIAVLWHQKKEAELSQKYAAQILSRLQDDVFPLIGDQDIARITRKDLVAVVEAVAQRGVVETAHKLAGYIGRIMDLAVDRGLLEQHPGASLSRILESPVRTHHPAVSVHDAPKVFKSIWQYNATVATSCALRLALLTALRGKELAGAKWDEILWEEAVWIVPAERMKRKKPHVVPLSRQAIVELKRLQESGNEYIFMARRRKFMHPETVNKTLQKLGFKGEQTGHGLRAVFSSCANESKLWHKDAIERQLAHNETDEVRAAYDRAEHLDERRKLMQWWADYIDAKRDD